MTKMYRTFLSRPRFGKVQSPVFLWFVVVKTIVIRTLGSRVDLYTRPFYEFKLNQMFFKLKISAREYNDEQIYNSQIQCTYGV